MQFFLSVPLPIVRKLAVGKVVHENRVTTLKDTAELVEAYRRQLIRRNRETEQPLKGLVLIMRDKVLYESKEVPQCLIDTKGGNTLSALTLYLFYRGEQCRSVANSLHMKAETVLVQQSKVDDFLSLAFRYFLSYFFER